MTQHFMINVHLQFGQFVSLYWHFAFDKVAFFFFFTFLAASVPVFLEYLVLMSAVYCFQSHFIIVWSKCRLIWKSTADLCVHVLVRKLQYDSWLPNNIAVMTYSIL